MTDADRAEDARKYAERASAVLEEDVIAHPLYSGRFPGETVVIRGYESLDEVPHEVVLQKPYVIADLPVPPGEVYAGTAYTYRQIVDLLLDRLDEERESIPPEEKVLRMKVSVIKAKEPGEKENPAVAGVRD
ncbi:MAG: hypothetical protein HYW25_01170 [Candidatus Aenigmarchaeota archaeon]|nr:hypothetical protein [Candidatus Aenigmarchaeota archaeon]